MTYGIGEFPSIAFLEGHLWCAYQAPGNVLEVWRDDQLVKHVPVPNDDIHFAVLTAWRGDIYLAWHEDNQGKVLKLGDVKPRDVNDAVAHPIYGNHPMLFAGDALYYQTLHEVRKQSLDGTVDVPVRADARPTGIVRIDAHGVPVFWDEDRTSVPGMTCPTFAGPLAVGEDTRQLAARVRHLTSGQELTLWVGLECFEPVIAQDPFSQRFAVATWGSKSVRSETFFLIDLKAPDAPKPIPHPVPPQPQPPEPTKVPDVSVPSHLDVVVAACNAHPGMLANLKALQAKGESEGWKNDDTNHQHAAAREALVRVIGPAVHAVDADWGFERKDGYTNSVATLPDAEGIQRHVAVQCLMHKPTGKIIQVLSDDGPVWEPAGAPDTRSPEFWIFPEPTEPPPPLPDDPKVAALKAQLADAQAKLAALQAANDGLIQERAALQKDITDLTAERDALKARPAPKCSVVPAWASFFVKVKCE